MTLIPIATGPSIHTRQAARANVRLAWERLDAIKPFNAMPNLAAIEEVKRLKPLLEEKLGTPVLFVIHSYQRAEVKALMGIDGIIGDSFALAQAAAKLPHGSTVFQCTVDFMAETTAILRPDLKIFVPSHDGGCGLADYITGQQIREWRAAVSASMGVPQTELPVVLYINTYADAKAEANAICTSSNALQVVNAMQHPNVLFAPDENLYYSIKGLTDKNIIPWRGSCPIHQEFTYEMAEKAVNAALAITKGVSSKAGILIHPECVPDVHDYVTGILRARGLTTAVLSTLGMQVFVREHPEISIWVIGTEIGLIESLQAEPQNKNKTFIPIYKHTGCDYNCACPYMKSVFVENVFGLMQGLLEGNMGKALAHGKLIEVAKEHADAARAAIELMVRIGRGDGKGGY